MTDQELQQTIGARLRDARLQRGLTQTELGERLGVSRDSMANYETGRTAISVVRLVQAAAVCNVPLSVFDVLTADGAVARIARTLQERPDAIAFVDEVLRSFAPPHSPHAPAATAPVDDRPRSSDPAHSDAAAPAPRATARFRPARRRRAVV